MSAIYENPTDAAKGIRKELKAAFPGIKFSVRTKTFANGNAIEIIWSFGPTEKAVDAITGKYAYGRFDSSTDSSSIEDTLVSMPDGDVRILGGAKFVSTYRNYRMPGQEHKSDTQFRERVARDICALNKVEYKGPETQVLSGNFRARHWAASALAHRVLRRTDLTAGYGGLRLLDDDSLSWEESVAVIPDAETLTPAGPPPSVFASEVHAAAHAVVDYMGPAGLRMSSMALRGTVFHRCYVRFPALDRQDVLSAVLGILIGKLVD